MRTDQTPPARTRAATALAAFGAAPVEPLIAELQSEACSSAARNSDAQQAAVGGGQTDGKRLPGVRCHALPHAN